MTGFYQPSSRAAFTLPFLLFVVLCFVSGCIQHNYITSVRPDGSVTHTYEAIGDSADLYDGCITLPTGFWWRIETKVEYDSAGDPIHTYRGTLHLHSVKSIPVSYATETVRFPEILLRHPIDYFRFDAGLAVVFLYQQTFISREKDAKYGSFRDYLGTESLALLDSVASDSLTEEERALLEEEYLTAMLTWVRTMMMRRCQLVLTKALEMHPEVTFTQEQMSTALGGAKDYITEWAPNDDGTSLLLGEIALWDSIGKLAMDKMVAALTFVGNTTFFEDIEQLGDLYQWEFDITKDLEDDEFLVQISLPGITFYHNADRKESGSLVWEFTGEDFLDEDVVIIAQSVYFRWLPTLILGLVILMIVIAIIRRKSRRRTVSPIL